MNEDGMFNPRILVDKLAKINCSQQSIETLSHWCIFHMKNAEQVVETWEHQFHVSPRDQRISFLYLANDILQNSRRKGLEFVVEFWKVLPRALNDVIENSDEQGKKAALRLVDIWEDRKVFSPQGHNLKEELLGRNKNETNASDKLKQTGGDMLVKLVGSYRHVSNSYREDILFGKCKAALSAVSELKSEAGGEFNLGSRAAGELQVQQRLLRECIEQLKVAESSRTVLVTHLKEALHEQEYKIEELRDQLQVAKVQYEQVERMLTGQAPPPLPEKDLDEVPPPPPASAYTEAPPPPPDFPPESPKTTSIAAVQATSAYYTPNQLQGPQADLPSHQTSEAHWTAASSDAGTVQSGTEHASEANKRPRLDNAGNNGSLPSYLPQQQPAPPHLPQFEQIPLPPMPLLPFNLSPVPPPLLSFSYAPSPVQPLPPPYPVPGVPPPFPGLPNPFQFQGSEGGYFGPPPQPPHSNGSPPVSRQ